MNYPDGYQEMSTEEFIFWETVADYIDKGYTKKEAHKLACNELQELNSNN